MTRFGPKTDRKITELLSTGRFTLSAEIIPPRNGANPETIIKQVESLTNSGSQFLAVTKGAGGSLRGGSLPIAQMIKDSFQTPCIAHFTCRDLLPEEVENQLIDHHFFGIRNILALRGDPPVGIEKWNPREGSYPYAYQLVEQIQALNHGRYLDRPGFKSTERAKMDFCIGVACYPDHENPKERRDFYSQKVKAGAEFAITQMLFDADSYARFIDEAAKDGITIPVLPGTRMLKSREQAAKVGQRFGVPIPKSYLDRLPETDAQATPESTLAAFAKFTEELRTRGAPGMHVFVLNDTELASQALTALSKA
ncbi:MAG: methylenetetrahydrofolate reductase [Bdellovibrionota bacterium]